MNKQKETLGLQSCWALVAWVGFSCECYVHSLFALPFCAKPRQRRHQHASAFTIPRTDRVGSPSRRWLHHSHRDAPHHYHRCQGAHSPRIRVRLSSFVYAPVDRFTRRLSKNKKSFTQEINDLWVHARNLPPVIRQIVRFTSLSAIELLIKLLLLQCLIQFLCAYHHVL